MGKQKECRDSGEFLERIRHRCRDYIIIFHRIINIILSLERLERFGPKLETNVLCGLWTKKMLKNCFMFIPKF